ncbi:MAG: type IV secretion system DNA-binding domain-containing protein [candidate division Zixibacteria bacterium]|nr:type IV secretion system DNA-binding domain-containing protein [candidate division Zixibacteria bacterium]
MKRGFDIGQNTLNGKQQIIDFDDMFLHWLIVGGTGRGKSKMLELRMRYHLDNNHGMILLDPHGTLYDDLLAYVTVAGYRNRVVLINPNDSEYSVGLNFLKPNGMDVSAHASQVMKAIAKVFGEAEGETKPRLERWQRNLLISLIEANLTLADMLDFLSVSSSLYRESVLDNVQNNYVKREWQGFDAITKRSEKENLIEAPLNRAAKMILSDPIRRIIGQTESTVDIGEAIEKGKIILVNLAPLKVSRECQQILGILIVDQIMNYAFQRTKRQAKKPFFVIADEAAELTSNDLPYSLQALRKFGIYFTLCYQTLTQIRRIPGYYENVMTNCDVKVAFKSSRQDSEELVGELFAGQIHGEKIKDEIHHSLLIPHETVREVVSSGTSSSRTRGEVNTEGTSDSYGGGSGSSDSFSSGSANHLIPADGILYPVDIHSITNSESSGHASSDYSMSSSGSSSSFSEVSSNGESESSSKSIVPFYEFMREQELSSRQYYSIEEIKEQYIAWIMCQPQRHAQIKLKDDKTIPVFIAYVDEVRVREKDCQKVVNRSNEKYALPAVTVDKLIEERRLRIVQRESTIIDVTHEEEEIVNSRWQ